MERGIKRLEKLRERREKAVGLKRVNGEFVTEPILLEGGPLSNENCSPPYNFARASVDI
jgi:hypothetical protein